MTKLLGLLFIASTTLAACADSNDEFADAAAGVEGIYKISTYTHNAAACSAGGESRLRSDTYAVAATQDVLGHEVLMFMSCASPTACRAQINQLRAGEPFVNGFTFTTNELDGAALTGRGASSGSLEGGRCVGGAKLDTMFVRTATRLTVEQRSTPAKAYAPEDGICWTDGAQANAIGSCTQMEHLTADFVEAL